MAEKSSYLQYLPPVLWETEPAAPEFSLGAALRIFEKILTGIADDVTIPHGDHAHPPITTEIARLDRLFDPWKAPESFLPWLASWVALEFPTLQGRPLWDDYQRRKVTSEIAGIHRLRGLKAGLNTHLDLYAVGQTRPRVALDDGSRVLVTTPRPAQLAPVTALVTQGPVLVGDAVRAEGLLRPWCMALGANGSLFVGDVGTPAGVVPPLKSRVWRLDTAGHYDLAGTPPKPRPLKPDTLPRTLVQAMAVRPPRAGQPETLYVLDRSGRLYAIPSPYTGTLAEITSLASGGTTVRPVAMCADGNGDLLVLDGDGPGMAKIIRVGLDPLRVTRTPLQKVIKPLSMLMQPDGTLIIGDGGDQDPAGPAQFAGNLVRIDRSHPANWTETLLLPESNPLVAPTGVTRIDDTHLHVLDVGLKPFGGSFLVSVAQPACVYRVDLATSQRSATRVTDKGHLVFPTGMVADGSRLIICDPGQPEGPITRVPSRLRPFQFDIVIHFAHSRLPSDAAERKNVLQRVVGNILTIVDQQKPAHTVRNLVTAI